MAKSKGPLSEDFHGSIAQRVGLADGQLQELVYLFKAMDCREFREWG